MSAQNLGKKKKEKPLDLEDAIQLVKTELAPFWHGTSPQLVSIDDQDRYVLLPLDATFSHTPWLICCIDPTTLNNELLFSFIKEWDRRYYNHPIKIMLVLSQNYSFLKNPSMLARLMTQKQWHCTVAIDVQGTLLPALNASGNLKILLQHGTNRYFEYEEEIALQNTENDLQKFLRSRNPGLPLSPLFQSALPFVKDQFHREFGAQRLSLPFSNGTFSKKGAGEEIQGSFTKLLSEKDAPTKNELSLFGEWQQNHERIMTADAQAQMFFTTSFSELGIVAGGRYFSESFSGSIECIVGVEMNGAPVHTHYMGRDLNNDDLGISVIKVGEPRVYSILTGLPQGLHRIGLRFLNTNIGPIELYGLRFAELKR